METLALYNLNDAVHLVRLLTFATNAKTRELKYPGEMVPFDCQEPLKSCTEYLSEWLTKHRDHESASEMGCRVAVGFSSIKVRQENPSPKNPVPYQCQCVSCQKAPNTLSRLHAQMNWFMSKLNKDQRRWFAGLESNRIGKEGPRRIASITGLTRGTILRGSEQVSSYSEGLPKVNRGRGPGRRPIREVYPDIESVLTGLVGDGVAGDPTSDKQWVRRSSWQLSKELKGKGYQVCNRVVCQLLKSMGFSMRVNVKTRASTSHAPSRDAQFEYITAQRKAYLAANLPVISVDTKKKELIGNFMAKGRSWCKNAIEVNDYSYASLADCLAVPYGVYDVAKNHGYVYVGTSVDTPELAATAVQNWWTDWGRQGYPGKTELLILADGGGSNGCRSRAWRKHVQTQLCDELGLTVTVCHYPPNCSKYNPIERRLFSHISLNWAGKPLLNLEVMLAYIRGTKTAAGLAVEASLLEGGFKKGERITKKELNQLALRPHEQCPAWNYTIVPRTTGAQGNSIDMG